MASTSGGVAAGSTVAERRLCGLVTCSLCRVSRVPSQCLTQESERELLISLTSVSREIQRWTDEIDSSVSEQGDGCHCCLKQDLEDEHVCLSNVVYLLVVFLTINNSYACHLVENILVVTFKYLARSESRLVDFLCLLWTIFEASVSSSMLLSSSSQLRLSGKNLMPNQLSMKNKKTGSLKVDDHAMMKFIVSIHPLLLSSSCHMVGSLSRVFHIIFKGIKLDNSDIMEVYVRLALSSLSKIPWENIQKVEKIKSLSKSGDSMAGQHTRVPGLTYITYGAVFQLVCSLADQEILQEVRGLDDSETYLHFTITAVKLLSCSLSSNNDNNCTNIFRYIRHKALMLMFRLSFRNHWKSSSILWLNLLRKYFEDLLYRSLSKCHNKHSSCLEGSPFCNEENIDRLCTCHLQRLAILLFFKCCFQLFKLDSNDVQERDFATELSTWLPEMQLHKKESCNMGFAELSLWVERHTFLEKYIMDIEDQGYSISCCRFSLTFLQLYVDEDDMLFEILLQLSEVPFLTMQVKNVGDNIHDKIKKESMLHISNIFNLIHLFHLFLSMLHYDHLVLLDYLISKDVAVQCLQYLLRSLRMVCRSWDAFVKFSKHENESNPIVRKKLKMTDAGNNLEDHGKHNMCSRHYARQRVFENAKHCLLSLKQAIEDLHKKNLFPYNPSVLLKSFIKFQELCKEQDKINGDGKVAEETT